MVLSTVGGIGKFIDNQTVIFPVCPPPTEPVTTTPTEPDTTPSAEPMNTVSIHPCSMHYGCTESIFGIDLTVSMCAL